MANLEERRIASGFGFLGREAGFEIGESVFLRYGASDSYLRALFVGLTNTLAVALIGIVLATGLGTAGRACRLSRNSCCATLSAAYIEFVRNVPLLVQLFFWYAVITEGLPQRARGALAAARGVPLEPRHLLPDASRACRSCRASTSPAALTLTPEFAALLVGLVIYTAALHRRDRARRHPGGRPRPGRGGACARPVAPRRRCAWSCCRRRCA